MERRSFRERDNLPLLPLFTANDLPSQSGERKIHRLRGKALELHLDAVERRVLGSLMEKDITTPEYYPLTLNALLAACNQKSSREPVMELEEAAVREALRLLEEKGLAGVARAEGRVARFEHRMGEVLNLGRRESALLCTLLLRGAQTPGELRGRSERMHHLEDLDEVNLVLQKVIGHDPPLARLLPRQTGTKEARYADLFGGDDDGLADGEQSTDRVSTESREERLAALEGEVAQMRAEIEALRRELSDFRGQFGS
jgi:uncharacterized protein YceH (UPF0502 family)